MAYMSHLKIFVSLCTKPARKNVPFADFEHSVNSRQAVELTSQNLFGIIAETILGNSFCHFAAN